MSRTGVLLAALVALSLPAARVAAQVFLDVDQPLPAGATAVAGGDLDGDGDRDLVTCSADPNDGTGLLRVWLNDGSSHFTAGPDVPVLAGADSLAVLDLNGDEKLDVLLSSPGVASIAPGGLQVLFGDGAGSFKGTLSQFLGGAPERPSLGDVDGDGDIDLAVVTPGTAAVAVLTNSGSGSFSAPVSWLAGPKPVDAVLCDLQLDGDPDLVALDAPATGSLVTRRLGAAGAGFGAAASYALAPDVLRATRFCAAPLDLDAWPDLLLSDGPDFTLELLHGDGAGGFVAQPSFPGHLYTTQMLPADLDLDGHVDVLVAHMQGAYEGGAMDPGVLLYRGGSGALVEMPGAIFGYAVPGISVGDLDGDLLPDLAAARGDDKLATRLGNGLGGFVDVNEASAGGSPIDGGLADFDGDGFPDLAVGETLFHSAQLLRSDGAGGLHDITSIDLDLAPFDSPYDCDVADVNGDGREDMLLPLGQSQKLAVLRGDGAGGFAPVLKYPSGLASFRLAARDVDGDGDPDAILCGGSTLSVLRNVGGDFQAPVSITIPDNTFTMAAGDVDGNGVPDVVTSTQYPLSSEALLRGNGAGGWLPPIFFSGDLINFENALALADVNDDGFDDVVSAYNPLPPDQGLLRVRLANGTGNLLPPQDMVIPYDPTSLAFVDIDVDGDLDALIGQLNDGSGWPLLSIRRGDGHGGFGAAEWHLPHHNVSGLFGADMDLDGLPDIVAVRHDDLAVTVLRNVEGDVSPWTQLGSGLAGDTKPGLAGAGTLKAGSPGAVTLLGAPPLAPGVLFLAAASAPTPFKGGLLVPVPPLFVQPLVVPQSGLVHMPWSSWPAAVSGASFYLQAAVADAGAPAGVALTGALRGVVP